MTSEFMTGFFYWWRGWKRLWQSRALGFYAFLPLCLAGLFFFSVFWITLFHLSGWTKMVIDSFAMANEWVAYLRYPIWVTLFVFSLFCLVYLSYLVHVILCGPFYTLLAERALKDMGKPTVSGFWLSLRMVRVSLVKSLFFLFLGLGILLFSLVPVLNVVSVIMVLMILAFDTMDYSFEAMGLGFRQRLRYFINHIPQWVGMAVSLSLTLLIPGLTLLILPGAVVGAAQIADVENLGKGANT